MTASMPTSEVLNLAADYLERFGWAERGGWYPKHGEPACAEGAIRRLCTEAGDAYRKLAVTRSLGEYLAITRPHLINPLAGYVIVFDWNDRSETTEREVIEVLRAAALIEAAREDAALLAEAGRSA